MSEPYTLDMFFAEAKATGITAAELFPKVAERLEDYDREAQALYEANGNAWSCPTWDQLGDVTRSVWIDRAIANRKKAQP